MGRSRQTNEGLNRHQRREGTRAARGDGEEEPAMGAIDVVIWLLAGLIAGGLAGAGKPNAPRIGHLVVVGASVIGALAGGGIAGSLAGTSAIAFLGAATIGVSAAVL